ncbi:MAG: 2-dehydro-3-deoxygalactonokinase, partial [Bacteroidota bacterium]
MKQNQLLCCDWGTTSFRLYLINTATSEIISMVKTDQGIARTFEAFQMEKAENRVSFFRKYLNTQIEVLASKSYQNLENTTIILSGMASSSIGMQEVPYQKTPFRLNQPQLCIEYFPGNSAFSNDVYLYGGLRTEEEVMRGEEVQLLGLSHLIEKDACVCILPGTHSKHIWLEEKVVTDFQTYMTGECFQLMSQQSILKQSVIPSLEFSTQNQRFFKE